MRFSLLTATLIAAVAWPLASFAQHADANAVKPNQAQIDARKAEIKAKWDSLSPEKQAEIKKRHAERRAKWEALSPEEKAAKKAERKAKWDAMTPEQKQAAKERHLKRKAMRRAANGK